MKLEAQVREVKQSVTHWLATSSGRVEVDAPSRLQIVTGQGHSVLLLRLDADGKCLSDTWHRDLEEAKMQAEYEYGVIAEDWSEASS
jgi:hypothetical protein